MNKVYMVVSKWADWSNCENESVCWIFDTYEKAKKKFDKVKKEIKSYENGYNEITDRKDYYEEEDSNYGGTYSLVYIEEKKVW